MSGLVGYGDSSDEDDETPSAVSYTPPQDSHLHSVRSVTNSTDLPQVDVHIAKEQSGPIGPQLGPTGPSENDGVLEDSPELTLPVTSPRNMVQSLTAPTVPVDTIPPSPPGSPDPAANARFARFLELKMKGIHFNADLTRKSSYSNPSLFSTLLERSGLQEHAQYATSLPLKLWDVSKFPASAYKESLAKNQQHLREEEEVVKKAQSAAGKRVLDFVPQSDSASSSHRSTPRQDSERHSKSERHIKKNWVA